MIIINRGSKSKKQILGLVGLALVVWEEGVLYQDQTDSNIKETKLRISTQYQLFYFNHTKDDLKALCCWIVFFLFFIHLKLELIKHFPTWNEENKCVFKKIDMIQIGFFDELSIHHKTFHQFQLYFFRFEVSFINQWYCSYPADTKRWINVGLRWFSVVDGEPTLNQHWFNVLCLLGNGQLLCSNI